ncbi:MAG: 23S rRNA (uracil(1939)-C(5))-methyltransferase RlmD [Corallococcus sp.]|nr:23S rRNA (uracil(1939)-C(5))-methyltransferase RlmD [Corallococcus sp.]
MEQTKLKQDDIIQVVITRLGTNGEGVAHYGEYTVFVDFALPEETVTCKVTYVKNNICFAKLQIVDNPSASRQSAPCKYFGKCGGCGLQHMTATAEDDYKRALVQNNLQKIGGLHVEVEPVVSLDRLRYRNKVSLPVGGKIGNVRIGLYAKGSHRIVPVGKCLLCGNWADPLADILKNYFDTQRIAPYDESVHTGQIRHVVARYLDGQLLLTLVFNGNCKCDFHPLIAALGNVYGKFGLFVNINTGKNNVILGKTTQCVYGIKYIQSEENDIKFRLQPDSFFQVNGAIKSLLYAAAKEYALCDGTDAVVDCFSGVGLLSAALTGNNHDVYALEITPSAVQDADGMKQANGIKRLTNICCDVNEQLPELVRRLKGRRVSVVVDPPRKGLGERVCDTLLCAEPDKIVYISCDSATLARDLKLLSAKYDVVTVRPYNMFPSCSHVETLCVLRKKS